MGSELIIILVALIGLAILAMVIFVVWRRRQARRVLQAMGLAPEEIHLIEEDLRKGDQAGVLRKITIAQEQRRADFQAATGIDPNALIPEVGREISWADMVRHVFRVLEFDRTDTTIGPNDKVTASSMFTPYGYLLVQSPILNQPVKLPIIHRDDFWLAASVFDEPKLANLVTTDELLVTYAPKKVLPGGLSGDPSHVLHYVLTPGGTLDRYYAKDNDLHMSKPNPALLFGPFVYDGEIRVQVIPEPHF
ncbi:MAG: hypothetical protein M3R69_04205 [Acidobacteriota bacterium]|nr:hypothetical protein [Acidobacteriota bacterium]